MVLKKEVSWYEKSDNRSVRKRYEAQIAEVYATINIYLEKSVGIDKHPQHIDEVYKQLQKISDAEEKINALQAFKI